MQVPFIDLKAQYESIRPQLDLAITSAIGEFDFLKGHQTAEFELAFGRLIGVKHSVGVANGTDALFLSLKAINIRPGDEVITPAWSWISSSETISLCGATPVFADVDTHYYTLDPGEVQKRITSSTRAVIAVHLYGQAAPVIELKRLCEQYNLRLIEDCAQAHLTSAGSSYAGSVGDLAAFSFYPTKNLGAYGDAGGIVTNDEILAEKVTRLANHGAIQKHDHLIEGTNSRMDTLQAAILLAKLPFLKAWTARRIKNAELYRQLLGDIQGIEVPKTRENTVHSFHLYVIRCPRRDDLKTYLHQHGIQTLIHYPQALTNLPAYGHLNLDPGQFPVANALEKEVLSLPIYPELTREQITYVGEKIRAFYQQ